jgi:archaellum biogenesis protein FlaJ (TadC family)
VGEVAYLLQVGQVIVYAVSATVFVMIIRGRVESVEVKVDTKMSSLEIQMAALTTSNQRLGDILTQLAVQRTEIVAVQEDIRELRHGRGWVRDDINGEYDNKGKTK